MTALKSGILSAVLAILPMAAGAGEGTMMQGALTQERLLLPDIAVTDSRGRTGGLVSRYGDAGPLLIGFIYTNCTELCGMTISIMSIVDMDLQVPDAPPLRLLAISVDPARDTPEALAEVAEQVQASPKWDWLVASPGDTPALLSAFGIPPGPLEQHPGLYLLGDMRTGMFRRLPGDSHPEDLLALARQMPQS